MSSSTEIELPRLRQGLYRFFAVAFLPPEPTRIEQLVAAADLLEDLGVEALAFAQPWRQMCVSLEAAIDVDALAGQYVHLFESGSDGALCPPAESFYASSARHGGPAVITADLESDFSSLGLTVSARASVDADHISAQLELMALLCAQEATACESGDLDAVSDWSGEQRQFTDKHLSTWVPRFAARVSHVASPGFYRSLVNTASAFIDHDRELLHALARRERTGLST